MGRTPKPVDIITGERPKADVEQRGFVEELFGANLTKDLKPSNRLNANQKKLFNFILEHFQKNVSILGDVDGILLENTAIAIDRLQNIEKLINADFDMIRDRELMAAKTKYTADFIKGVDYFGMSPASRAKLGIMGAKKKEQESDPLLKLLGS